MNYPALYMVSLSLFIQILLNFRVDGDNKTQARKNKELLIFIPRNHED